MSSQAIIFSGVAVYMVLMIVIGALAARKTQTADDFMVSGRRMPFWICTATLVATWFGGGPMVGVAGQSYNEGMLGVIADPFGSTLVLVIMGLFFARIMRRLKLRTFVEVFNQRYGTTAASVAAVASIMSSVGWTAGMLVAFGYVLQVLTGIPLEIGIVAGAVIVFIYTMAGGMWAVAITDFVQMGIIAIGLVVLFVVVISDLGGWAAVSARFPENALRILPLDNSPVTWLNYLRMWLIFGLADISSQSLIQRAMSSRSEQVAQNAFYASAVGYLTLGMIPVMLGIIAATSYPGIAEPNHVIATLALEHLHPVAMAVFVGALLAAIMSTTDSSMLSAASVFTVNLLPLIKPDASDRTRLWVTRLGIPVFGVVALVVGLKAKTVYQLVVDSNFAMLAIVVVPFVAGLWWEKANRTGVLASMVVGFVTLNLIYFLLPEMPADLLGMLAGLVTLLVVTPLT
ncbi:MAG: sodium:solute symporter family protein, partial [Chromatiales bacterium]|nr:sodium:solute symporter family protein [Chromatiales bacterium]